MTTAQAAARLALGEALRQAGAPFVPDGVAAERDSAWLWPLMHAPADAELCEEAGLAGVLARARAPRPLFVPDAPPVVVSSRAVSAAMHPAGRCECGGEGTCGWCARQRAGEEIDDVADR